MCKATSNHTIGLMNAMGVDTGDAGALQALPGWRFCAFRTTTSRDNHTFYCFSPPVMLATFIVEIALAAFVFVRYRTSRFGKVGGLILILLAVFQFAEYRVCGTTADNL